MLSGRYYRGLSSPLGLLVRSARLESTNHPGLPSWPSNPNPSPYEVFSISPQKFDKRLVKSTYYKLIKAYHPDSVLILNPEISLQERTKRFRKIKEAYDILKDDGRRRQYDFTGTAPGTTTEFTRRHGGPDKGPYNHFRASYSRPGFRRDFNPKDHAEAFYTGDPFGDYNNDKDFEEQLRQNRKTFTWIVAATVFVIGALELKALFSASDRAMRRAEHASFLSQLDELHAKSNYGMGLFPEDRISRFLAVRDSSGYVDNYNTEKRAENGSISTSTAVKEVTNVHDVRANTAVKEFTSVNDLTVNSGQVRNGSPQQVATSRHGPLNSGSHNKLIDPPSSYEHIFEKPVQPSITQDQSSTIKGSQKN
jgi:curved DNA-binding protein CbpA